jgi:hypothetical protein
MAEDDDDFDPDAFIERPGEPELDEEAKAAIRAAQAQERAEFEQAARKGKFDDFNRTETRVTSGTFHFRVRQRELQEVLATVGLTASKRNPHFSCMKVVIFRTMLKICTFNPGVFFGVFSLVGGALPFNPIRTGPGSSDRLCLRTCDPLADCQ